MDKPGNEKPWRKIMGKKFFANVDKEVYPH
jgi:hypothetical protein